MAGIGEKTKKGEPFSVRFALATDRAVRLAANVLAFGRTAEPSPTPETVPLRVALETAAVDAQLTAGKVALALGVDDRAQVMADPDQLHRIFVNLMRNAREAIDGDAGRGGAGMAPASASASRGSWPRRMAATSPWSRPAPRARCSSCGCPARRIRCRAPPAIASRPRRGPEQDGEGRAARPIQFGHGRC